MASFSPADHAMGLELQLEELFEQQRRAEVQGRADDVDRFQSEIEQLQSELAVTAELLAGDYSTPEPPELHDAEKLSGPEDQPGAGPPA
jgi:hypothetical protein